MPKTVDEYIEQTMAMIDAHGDLPKRLDPTSALLYYTAVPDMIENFLAYAPDFGFLVAWLRYGLTAQDLAPRSSPHWMYSEEQLRQHRAAAEAGFDQLLADFVQRGYQPEMEKRLLDIGNDNLGGYSLNCVYVLPNDLDVALQWTGNPFKDRWGHEVDDDSITAVAIGFDLTNPEHREKLLERLSMVV